MSTLKSQLKKALTIGGPFKLASGATSDTLVDLSQVLRKQITQDCLSYELSQAFLGKVDSVGGPVCGSDLVCLAACRAGIAPHWFGVRKDPKGRGYDKNTITGNLNPRDTVIVFEDVCTSGGNLLRCIPQILEYGAKIKTILAVVDRGGLAKVHEEFGIPTKSLFTLEELKTP